MITPAQARQLATRWIAAWNSHDLDAILDLYRADFTMSSPYIAKLTAEASGTLRGREAVGAYWRTALEKYADLHFNLKAVYCGADSLIISYHSNRSGDAVEILFVADDGLIARAAAHYE